MWNREYNYITDQDPYRYRNRVKTRLIPLTYSQISDIVHYGYLDILRWIHPTRNLRKLASYSIQRGYVDIYRYFPNFDLDISPAFEKGHLDLVRVIIKGTVLNPKLLLGISLQQPYIFRYLTQIGLPLKPSRSLVDTQNLISIRYYLSQGGSVPSLLDTILELRSVSGLKYLLRRNLPEVRKYLQKHISTYLNQIINWSQYYPLESTVDVLRTLIRAGYFVPSQMYLSLLQMKGSPYQTELIQTILENQDTPFPNRPIPDPAIRTLVLSQYSPFLSYLLQRRMDVLSQNQWSSYQVEISNGTLNRVQHLSSYEMCRTIFFTGDPLSKTIIPPFPYGNSSPLTDYLQAIPNRELRQKIQQQFPGPEPPFEVLYNNLLKLY